MPEDEKLKPKAEEKIKEAKPAEEKAEVTDKAVLEIIGTTFGGDYAKIQPLIPSFKTIDGDMVRGIEWLDPGKPLLRGQFLSKPEYKDGREQLLRRLQVWKEYLSTDKAIDFVRQDLSGQAEKLEKNLELNLRNVHKATRELETTYRAIDKFLANARMEPDEPVEVWFSNISLEKLGDPDDKTKFEQVSKYVADLFREFSIANCFSLCVLPGFLGDVQKIDTFARQLGMPNKLHIVTDLPNFEHFEDVMELLNDPNWANLAGNEDYKQYISLCGNYILARPRNQYEDEDLWVPPSTVLAGLIYRNDSEGGIHQPAAGYKYGKASEVSYVKFRINQPEAGAFADKGVVPSVLYDGNVRFMGDSTLYKGETFSVYSIRRTFDYIYKNLHHYLNKQAFLVIDQKLKDTLKKDMTDFLDRQKFGTGILESYKLTVFADEKMMKNQEVDVIIEAQPKYPVKAFNIKIRAWNDPKTNQTGVKDNSGT